MNYKQLNALHERYFESGLTILAFPCKQFGGQEFKTCGKIQKFAEKKGVEFQMMEVRLYSCVRRRNVC